MQRFVNEMVSAVHIVAEDFRHFVRQLDMHDYSHIQRIALQQEGHPLGDYLAWLFESVLAYQFRSHAGLRREQKAVDQLTFEECLPCERSTVGVTLNRAYWMAQTLPVDAVGHHPWVGDDDFAAPMYELGDLFVNELGKSAYVLINAPCDLRFVPGNDSKRPWDRNLSLILIPGRIEPLDVFQNPKEASTPYWDGGNDEPCRIVWDVKGAITVSNDESLEFVNSGRYSRAGRLRSLHVLTIKASYLNTLARLGTPVSPPIVELWSVKLLLKGEGNHEPFGSPVAAGCMLFSSANKTDYILTTEAVRSLIDCAKEHLQNKIARLTKEIEALDKGNPYYEKQKAGKKEKRDTLQNEDLNIEDWL